MRIVVGLLFLCTLVPLHAQEGEYEADLEKQLFQAVNQERERRGIAPLKWSDELRESARRHTDRITEAEMLSHQFKDEPPLMQRVAATKLSFFQAAENVALATDWPDIHTGLMQSEGHRHNILNPIYTDIGIGVRKRGSYYYVTQNFARTTKLFEPEAAEQKISKLLLKDRRFARLKVASNQTLRSAACDMANRDRLNAQVIPTVAGDRAAIAFTSNDLDELPPAIDQVASQGAASIRIGSCFKATPTYPGGTYWFALVY
jgi:hypothetical protein